MDVSDEWCFCLWFLQSRKTMGLRWPPLPPKTGPQAVTPSQTLSRSRKAQAPVTSRTPCLVCPHPVTFLCPTPPSQVSASGELLLPAGGSPALLSKLLRYEGKTWVWVLPLPLAEGP